MDSLSFKKIYVGFDSDMQALLEDLEVAVDGGMDQSEQEAVITRAIRKLARYEDILVELSPHVEKLGQFKGRFAEPIDEIGTALQALKSARPAP